MPSRLRCWPSPAAMRAGRCSPQVSASAARQRCRCRRPQPVPTSAKGCRAMTTKTVKIPSAEHPITIERNPNRIAVTVNGHVIAVTTNALTLREASYPAVFYVPRGDVDMTQLAPTEHATYCPYKGDCAYYSIPAG